MNKIDLIKIILSLVAYALWFVCGWIWNTVYRNSKKKEKVVQIQVASRSGSGLFYYQDVLVPVKKLDRLIKRFGREGRRHYCGEPVDFMKEEEA